MMVIVSSFTAVQSGYAIKTPSFEVEEGGCRQRPQSTIVVRWALHKYRRVDHLIHKIYVKLTDLYLKIKIVPDENQFGTEPGYHVRVPYFFGYKAHSVIRRTFNFKTRM